MGIVYIKVISLMDSVKNRGRNKFSSCFNPITTEDEPCLPPSPSTDGGHRCRKKKTPHNSLSGFVKAVFFKTPLLKKLRSQRSKRDSYKSTINLSSKLKRLTKREKILPSSKKFSDREDVHYQDNSDRSSLFSSTSSSRASSISSNSSLGSERIKAPSDSLDSNQTSTNIRRHAMKLVSSSSKCDCRGLTFIILVCLVALVFWGKVFAIVACTSTWLLLAPGRVVPQGGGPQANIIVDSEEYKKRVIMEGLLDRNMRSRVVR